MSLEEFRMTNSKDKIEGRKDKKEEIKAKRKVKEKIKEPVDEVELSDEEVNTDVGETEESETL